MKLLIKQIGDKFYPTADDSFLIKHPSTGHVVKGDETITEVSGLYSGNVYYAKDILIQFITNTIKDNFDFESVVFDLVSVAQPVEMQLEPQPSFNDNSTILPTETPIEVLNKQFEDSKNETVEVDGKVVNNRPDGILMTPDTIEQVKTEPIAEPIEEVKSKKKSKKEEVI